MGYRVGHQCVSTQLQADDLILSAQQPAITEHGGIIRPVRHQDGWYINGSKLQLSYPECSHTEQIGAGAQIGAAFVLLLATAYGIRQIIKFIGSLGSVGSSED